MSESQRYDVFLSYASPDNAWVAELAEQLRALGLNVFLDKRELNFLASCGFPERMPNPAL